MKKIALIVLISLIGLFAVAQAPHPALCYTRTGQAEPAFIALKNLTGEITDQDWVGCYDADNMLCYGAFKAEKRNHYVGAFLDEAITPKKDGFDYGDVINLFYYKASTKRFYEISGTFVNAVDNSVITQLKCYPLALYYVTDVLIKNEIQLAIDTELSAVLFNFIDLEQPVVTGGSDAVKLKFISQNTTAPIFTVKSGTGNIEKRWDGYYYKYSATDSDVVIEATGINNFTGQTVSDILNLTLDQSVAANTIFEDENMVIYLKNDQVWLKVKAEKLSGYVLRDDGGIWKRLYHVSNKTQGFEIAFIKGQYSRSWKGLSGKVQYLYYKDGKMMNKTFTEKSFTF